MQCDPYLMLKLSAVPEVLNVALTRLPSRCALVRGGRAVLPYEQPRATAELLAEFVAQNFDGGDTGALAAKLRGRRWPDLYQVLVD